MCTQGAMTFLSDRMSEWYSCASQSVIRGSVPLCRCVGLSVLWLSCFCHPVTSMTSHSLGRIHTLQTAVTSGYPEKLGSPWIRPRCLFSKIFNGLLFGWTLWMYWPNLKSVAFPVPEIIGGSGKNLAVPGYAHTPFSPKFLMGFCLDGRSECTGKIWSS